MKRDKLFCSIVISLVLSFTAVNSGVAGSISGTLAYGGSQTGAIDVGVFTSPINCTPPNPEPFAYIELSSLGTYTISSLPNNIYYVASIIETVAEPTNPWAVYGGCDTATPVTVIGNSDVSGIDLTLIDGNIANPNPFYEKYEIDVTSHHHIAANYFFIPGYYAYIKVKDISQNADSVTVSGPGITESMDLMYYESEEAWQPTSKPYIGSSVPSTPQTYTFTIADAAGTHVYSKTITGYVENSATNLAPTGNVDGPIIFSWTGIANADEYGVQLSNGWRKYNIPGTTTSIPYDGPSLVPGGVYHWDVNTAIITDGGYNLSLSQDVSFTFGVLQPPPGSISASLPNGQSFDFSTGTVDPSGVSGDFLYGSHNIIGLVEAPSGVSWWTGSGVSSFASWITDPSYLPPPEGWNSASLTYNSAGEYTRWLKTAEGRYAMIFSVQETDGQFDFYYVYPYGNFTWSDTEAPLPPTLLAVTDTGAGGSLLIEWQASSSSDVAGYHVVYSDSSGGIGMFAGNTNSYTLTNLTNGQLYNIHVNAYDNEGNKGDYSQTLSATPTADSDGDGLPDSIEDVTCTEANDADTDDDGIPDGTEDVNRNGNVDTGETDPCLADTDGDGIQDGTEIGLTLAIIGLDTDTDIFVPDAHPTTTTDPLDADSDNDGIIDGEEDANHNGRVDSGETDPSVSDQPRTMPWIPLLLLDE